MKTLLKPLISFSTFLICIPAFTWSQNPILRSTTTGTPTLMSQVATSLLTQKGNNVGIGTANPTQRLTLTSYENNSASIMGQGLGLEQPNAQLLAVHIPPAVRYEFYDQFGSWNYWHLTGAGNFSVSYANTGVELLSLSKDGSAGILKNVQVSAPSLAGNHYLGLTSDNTVRRIYWSAYTNPNNNNTSVPLEFMFDAYGTGTDVSVMKLMPSGQVRIGDAHTLYQNYVLGSAPNTNAAVRLTVEGNVAAQGFIATQQNWADFVFYEPQHNPTLADEEVSIKQHCTLVGVPNETEVASGRSLADNDALLLQKLEQLYLHVIALDKQLSELQKENLGLKALLKP